MMDDNLAPVLTEQLEIDAFIQRWSSAGGTERANYQLFLTELCRLLDLPQPDPASSNTEENAYVFERLVRINHPDGTQTHGYIDLYKRGCFVCEAKQSGKLLDSSGWDKAMLKAQNQADLYARSLSSEEGRPPFIIVTDVGRNIELYSEFSRSGATYTPYPDALSHRIRLEDLRKEEIRERLKSVWMNPLSLDPSRHAARVTREIADNLAVLARSLESDGHTAEDVAAFLMRALFTMFAEDVGLLPDRSFTELLDSLKGDPDSFAPMLESLWVVMNNGGFSPILRKTILRFNGGLFSQSKAIPLSSAQFDLLLKASHADWKFVEPAIFGTLLERALNPRERHKLGAHYTPRAYVERLVLPTVIEPLRDEWQEVQAAALTYEQQGKTKQALNEIRAFHRHLCSVRVLDPACGSGNFLYVTLEHLKRLEGEVLNLLHDLGESRTLETEGLTVDPHQFLGLEINPRAAKIAEMVLWIGYLQWHFRTMGNVNPPEPVLRDFKNIENRDALIAYQGVEAVHDENGNVLTRWDGITTKPSPITGEEIPDETARTPVYRYLNPRQALWPQANYIVGNPPFIGNKKMRLALGDGYVTAIRNTWPEVADSADFVMYWWHIAAETVRNGQSERFGFITTNSLSQTFNRRVIQRHLNASKNPLSLTFAIPDHPWVDASDGAAVRIAMSVGQSGEKLGSLSQVVAEADVDDGSRSVVLNTTVGRIYADLSIGADVASAKILKSNSLVSNRGMIPHGEGFIITAEQGKKLDNGALMRPYRNGRDLTSKPRGVYVLDTFDLDETELKAKYPETWQWLFDRVKPDRDENKRKSVREKWWRFAEPRKVLRSVHHGLNQYIATVQTSKHNLFTYLSADILPDDKLIAIGLENGPWLGVLSSRVHTVWALAAGSRMGVGNDPVYVKSSCFEAFPFAMFTEEQAAHIAKLGEQIDTHRKRQQAKHTKLGLTDIYNVLEKLRAGIHLTEKDKVIHEQGVISLLRDLHDELDKAVFAAYGWNDLADQLVGLPGATTTYPGKSEAQAQAENELLTRLVKLNSIRAAEEARGQIRWLRPEIQNPASTTGMQQSQVEMEEDAALTVEAHGKATWPKNMREQVAAVRSALHQTSLSAQDIAKRFKRSPAVAVQSVLDALEDLGMVQEAEGLYRIAA